MQIIDSAKKFVKDHTPETIIAVGVGVAVVAGTAFVARRNCLHFNDEIVQVLAGGGAIATVVRGTQYVVAQRFYLPEDK